MVRIYGFIREKMYRRVWRMKYSESLDELVSIDRSGLNRGEDSIDDLFGSVSVESKDLLAIGDRHGNVGVLFRVSH